MHFHSRQRTEQLHHFDLSRNVLLLAMQGFETILLRINGKIYRFSFHSLYYVLLVTYSRYINN